MLPCVILSYTVFKGASRLNNIFLTNLCYLNNFLAADGLLAVLILTKFTNTHLNFRLVHQAATSGIVCLIVYTVNDLVEQGFLTFFCLHPLSYGKMFLLPIYIVNIKNNTKIICYWFIKLTL